MKTLLASPLWWQLDVHLLVKEGDAVVVEEIEEKAPQLHLLLQRVKVKMTQPGWPCAWQPGLQLSLSLQGRVDVGAGEGEVQLQKKWVG